MFRAIAILLSLMLFGATEAPGPQVATTSPGFALQGRVTVDAAGQVADLTRIVVYLDSDPVLDAAPIPKEHYVVGQQNKRFVPNFIAVPLDARVEFPNWDSFDHNVFSRSAAAPAFDLQRYGCCMANARVFDKVGVVQVFCNIHPFMRAHIVVTPNRYFATADASGNFEIGGVPAGRYTLAAWQERSDEVRTPVDVSADVGGMAIKLVETKRSTNENAGVGGKYGVERGVGAKRQRLNLPVIEGIHPAIDPAPGTATTQPK